MKRNQLPRVLRKGRGTLNFEGSVLLPYIFLWLIKCIELIKRHIYNYNTKYQIKA